MTFTGWVAHVQVRDNEILRRIQASWDALDVKIESQERSLAMLAG